MSYLMSIGVGRRFAAALLSLALLLQGQVVAAMDCHGGHHEMTLQTQNVADVIYTVIDREPLGASDSAVAADHHHEASSSQFSDQHSCSSCAACGVMNGVIASHSQSAPNTFKSPSPSVLATALLPGDAPEGPLRPPR